jgi:polar amino acid transport system substrate-binding protein
MLADRAFIRDPGTTMKSPFPRNRPKLPITSLVHLLLALLSCHGFAAQADTLDRVRLQLQWKHQFEFAGFYAAEAQGYYADAGLEVEFVEFTNQTDTLTSLLDGTTDFALGYSSVIADYLQGQPVVLLANFLKRSPIAIVAQTHILTPRDLVGKRVMGIADNVDNITLLMMFDKFGVSPESVVHVPPSYNTEAFIRGEVEAMVVFTSNEVFELDRAGKHYNLFDPSLFGAEHYDVNLYTSRDQLQRHPDRVRRFREASIRGWQYALDNQSEIVDLIRDRYNTQGKSEDALRFEAAQIKNAVMPEVSPIGSIDEHRLVMIGADFIELGIVPAGTPLAFDGFLYREPTQQLQLSAGEQDYLAKKKVIRYCSDPDWMPLEKIEQGRHIGMSADYMALFAERLHIDLQLVPSDSWGRSLQFAEQRQCDLLSLAMDTPERRVYMSFTEPYLNFPLVIATRKDTLFILDLESILDKPLGVVQGYAFAELLHDRYPGINLVEVANLSRGLEQVANGELHGFIDSLATIGYVLQQEYLGELKIAGKFTEQWQLALAVRNDDPMLLDIQQKAVASITPEEHREITNRWLAVTYQEGIDRALVLRLMLAAAVIFMAFLYHSFVQARYVGRLRQANAEIRSKNEQLETLATTDKLTGLFNRHRLDELLSRQQLLFSRYRHNFSLILVDIDWFKRINDTLGHQAGDNVLRETAGLLSSGIRESDIIGRWGGEEFLIICVETDLAQAGVLAEKLRQRVGAHPFRSGVRQTISLGVAQMVDHQGPDALLKAADQALYQSKRAGRDRVSFG